MWFLDPPPKKKSTKVQIVISSFTISFSLDTEKSKWRISEKKKALKLPKFQKLISQELLGEKILLTFVSYK